MTKNFFEYTKELIPEKGSVFFEHCSEYSRHEIENNISLYQLADLLMGKKIGYAQEVTGFSWKVREVFHYDFDTVGIYFLFYSGKEKWIHFSKNAFIGAICIVATKNGVTFDDEEHEKIRQAWARKIEEKELEDDKKYTNLKESNFNDEWYFEKFMHEK